MSLLRKLAKRLRGGSQVLSAIEGQIETLGKGISALGLQLDAALSGDPEVKKAHALAAAAYADRAADDRFALIRMLGSGTFYAGIGELLITLVDHVKEASDATRRASRALESLLRQDAGPAVLATFSREAKEFVGLAAEAIMDLRASVSGLGGERKRSLAYALHCNEIEERADSLKDALLANLPEAEEAVASQLTFFVTSVDDIIDELSDAALQSAKIVARGGQ